MATKIEQIYLGDHRCLSTHRLSGEQIVTDAPTDHDGLGRSFAPTDLLATSAGSGALTAMSIQAGHLGWDMFGTTAETTKYIAEDAPRRVDRIVISITFPEHIDVNKANVLKAVAYMNPVYLSIKDSINVEFIWTNR